MSHPCIAECDHDQGKDLRSTPTKQDMTMFSGLLTPPASIEDFPQQILSENVSFKPRISFQIRPRVTQGTVVWRERFSPFDDEDGHNSPKWPSATPFDSLYSVDKVHRMVKSSRKQRALSVSYPLFKHNASEPFFQAGKRLPGSKLSVLESLPSASAPFEPYACASAKGGPTIVSPDVSEDPFFEDDPGDAQPTLELDEDIDIGSELEPLGGPMTPLMSHFDGGLLSPPTETPTAGNFYEHYRDQTTNRLALQNEYECLKKASVCSEVIMHVPTFSPDDTYQTTSPPPLTLEEDPFTYLGESFLELCEGGPPGYARALVRNPTRSDPFDANYNHRHTPVVYPAFPPDDSLNSSILYLYEGTKNKEAVFCPDQAFDDELLALYEGRVYGNNAVEFEGDPLSDNYIQEEILHDLA